MANKPFISSLLLFSFLSLNAGNFSVENIDSIVSHMSLEQKARLLNGTVSGNNQEWNFVANSSEYIPGAAAPTVAFPEYGIPLTILADGPAGLRIKPVRENDNRTFYCTAFPTGTALAATWDLPMVEDVAAAMGNEVLEYGCDVLLAPGVNIQRNPLCGRNFEYFSEDPLLAGEIAAAYINGIQSQGVGTSLKHYAANNQETKREFNDALISGRALREIYLRPFEIAVHKSDPWTIMSSYNKINGTNVSEDYDLLQTILRDEWGWDGIVMTDWLGPRNTSAQVHAGNDLLTPGSEIQINQIIEGVKNGSIDMADVDRNVIRMLRYISRTPHWREYAYSNTPDLRAHAAVARRAAAEGMVLLKNNGVLPLDTASTRRIALFGNGSYDLTCGGTGSGNVNRAYTTQLYSGLEEKGFDVNARLKDTYLAYLDYAMKKLYNDHSIVLMDFGRMYPFEEMPLPREAMMLRQGESDVAIFTVTRNSGEGRDRPLDGDYYLTDDELHAIRDLSAICHAEGKKLIVVLNIGAPVETASWSDFADAIVCAWQPGQEGGNALADVLSGKVNPSGRLPMTFAADYYDYPSSKNFPHDDPAVPQPHYGFWEPKYQRTDGANYDFTDYTEDIYVGYRHFDKKSVSPAYPFGFGLSYTDFSYGKPSIIRRGSENIVKVKITNSGSRPGREVVQLYVSAPKEGLDKPVKELRGFAKTPELAPGQSCIVEIFVSDADLGSFDEALNAWITEPGKYTFSVGSSSKDLRSEANVKIPRLVRPVIAKLTKSEK